MGSMAAHVQISEEDQLRAGWYALLAQLLSREPSDQLLQMLRGLEGDESELGEGIKALAATQGLSVTHLTDFIVVVR